MLTHSMVESTGILVDMHHKLADRPDLTSARLAMARAVGQVIRNGLAVIGVAAAEELH